MTSDGKRNGQCKSLSARRAWIEICSYLAISAHSSVALRKESVDRNGNGGFGGGYGNGSLSARRAWIEIISWPSNCVEFASRSPQGERG